MLNNHSKVRVASVWFAAVGIIVACGAALGASLASSALLFVVCAAPLGVAMLIGFGAPPPTVAELIRDVTAEREGRS